MGLPRYPGTRAHTGASIPYTPSQNYAAASVIVLGQLIGMVVDGLIANVLGSLDIIGVFPIAKDASVFAAGDPVYWLATGSPQVGVANSGCATSNPAGATLMGIAEAAQLTGDNLVFVDINVTKCVPKNAQATDLAATGAQGTEQNSTPTAAQLLTGLVTQTGATGAGTVTLPTGTLLSGAFASTPPAGRSFPCKFANLGGGQTLTITTATGLTLHGTVAVPTGKCADMLFVNSGANTWDVYCSVSA